MRRPARGHNIVFKHVFLGPGKMGHTLEAHCLICHTFWSETISAATKDRVIRGPNPRGTVASVVATAVSRTPDCEDVCREALARHVIEG